MKKLIVLAPFILSACGQTPTVTEVVNQAAPAASAEPALSDIQVIINDENSYREGLGQTSLTQGLSCTLYTITGGQYIQNDATHAPTLTGVTQVATFLLTGEFNQPNDNVSSGLNILPSALKNNPTYNNLIKVVCQGQVVITSTDYYLYDLYSDDGSVLYLDGSRLIDNDGNHGITDKQASKYLRRGVHAFRLDFAQTGGGNQALILMSNGTLVPGANFYH